MDIFNCIKKITIKEYIPLILILIFIIYLFIYPDTPSTLSGTSSIYFLFSFDNNRSSFLVLIKEVELYKIY
jgi:hypothetical protein